MSGFLSMEFKGGTRLQNLAGRVVPRLGHALGEEAYAAAVEGARIAKALAPVKTGELRSKIEAIRTGRTSAAFVSRAPHGIFPEFGTRTQRAQPHMRPAAQQVRARFAARCRERVRSVLAGAAS